MKFSAKSTAMAATLAFAAALGASSGAQAAYTYNYTAFAGDTTGGQTFNRPLEDLSDLSAVGTAVRYNIFTFTAPAFGDYTFVTTGQYDTFSVLYSTAFDPASPLTNALAANDDLELFDFTRSRVVSAITAGSRYVLVTTGFGNPDFGAYSVTIDVTVPEPAVYALLVLGLGLCLGLGGLRCLRQVGDSRA